MNCDPNTSDTLPIVTVDLHDGILRPIEQQQPLLRIYKTADRKHLEADILEDICATGKSTCPYFTRYGPVCLNGEQWVYVCGDEVIGLPPGVNYRITSDVAAKHLVYDPTLDPQDAVERFDRLLRGKGSKNQAIISTAYWPLWLFTLVTAFRSVIEDESTTTYFALLLCGKHGTRKTSAARMLTLLFDVEPNLGAFPVEFNASSGFKAIAAAITGVPDQTILVDDATIAGADTKEARLREETAQQLVRLCVNTSEQRYRDMLPRINAEIGPIRLQDIRADHLNRLYAKLAAEGEKQTGGRAAAKVDLAAMLQEKKIKQARISERSGISTSAISSAIKGYSVSTKTAQAVADALGMKLEDAFDIMVGSTTLSAKTIVEHHRLISSILSQAVKEQLIPSNTARRASPPKVPKKY